MSKPGLAYDKIPNLETLAGSGVDAANDYYLLYDSSEAKVKKVLADGSAFGDPRVNVTAATLAVTRATHASKIVTLNKADGIAVTLPAATGTGSTYEFIIGTTITSNSTTIKVSDASHVMFGSAIQAADSGSTNNMWETAADSDTITFNGTTTGGIKGDRVILIDIAPNEWCVNIIGAATGTEATPFSATV